MTIRDRFATLSLHVTEAVYTSMCAECNRRGTWVCEDCRSRLRPIARRGCSRCGVLRRSDCECDSLPDEIEQLRSVYPYAGWVRSSIHRFKYEGEFARAVSLGNEYDRIQSDLGPVDIIVPVPIHRRRLRERGFNQSALMARHLASTWGLGFVDTLERRVDSERQVGKARDERWLNVAGAFTCPNASVIRNQRVAVLDDVITTGATVSECAVALVAAGARSVVGISLARG